jgi:hypothetical protein
MFPKRFTVMEYSAIVNAFGPPGKFRSSMKVSWLLAAELARNTVLKMKLADI